MKNTWTYKCITRSLVKVALKIMTFFAKSLSRKLCFKYISSRCPISTQWSRKPRSQLCVQLKRRQSRFQNWLVQSSTQSQALLEMRLYWLNKQRKAMIWKWDTHLYCLCPSFRSLQWKWTRCRSTFTRHVSVLKDRMDSCFLWLTRKQ